MPPLDQRDDASMGSCGSPAPAPTHAPTRRSWWRSIEEKQPSPELLEALGREFPEGADELGDGPDRRTFMKLAGASAALAGIGLSGCRRWPESKIVPFAVRPAERVPGTPVTFATAADFAGVGVGLLAKSYDGRPIHLDGNPASWSGRGTSTITQARILEMYDPERSRSVLQKGQPANDAQFVAFARPHFDALKARGGEGLAILSDAHSGPSWADMQARVRKALPKATWTVWEPLSNDASLEGTAAAFGAARRPVVDFSKADVVVSFDDDFLNASPLAPRHTRDFAAARRRTLENSKAEVLSRLYMFESTVSVTGMNADERFALRSALIPAVAARVALDLGLFDAQPAIVAALTAMAQSFDPAKSLDARQVEVMNRLVEDLRVSRGRSVVVAGPRQPAAVHALCTLLNDALGNADRTVSYVPSPDSPSVPQIAALAKALQEGKVDTLLILGSNPIYTAPADLGFAAAMSKAGTVIHHSLSVNETSRSSACTWHLPAAHFLECWGDVRAWDHSVSLQQPLILPLIDEAHGGRSELEMLAFVLGEAPMDGAAIVRRTHMAAAQSLEAEAKWRSLLEQGVVPGSAAAPEARLAVNAAGVAKLIDSAAAALPSRTGVELVLIADMKVWDGRFGSIGWLQELPDPVTKITWDNAALMSPATAKRLDLRKGDLVRLSSGGREVTAAAWPLPGHAEDSISLALGYGRDESSGSFIATGAGANGYLVRSTGAMHVIGDVAVTRGIGQYAIAHTQDHGVSEAIDPSIPHGGIQERLPTLVREATFGEYRAHPDFAKHVTHVAHRLSLWEESNLDGAPHRWALSIDLGTCTGCSACVVACQSENNIPIVGKDQVARGREMHWIRLDRYFRGDDPAKPEGFAIAPVTCMQCENAPCEQVCPVAATVHDSEGLNNMVYNRCIGTRYCSNNCPYKVRRFNFFDYQRRTPVREQEGIFAVRPEYYVETGPDEWLRMQFNPDVTVRMRGVMEKCTFCVQRIQAAKIQAKNAWARAGGRDGAGNRYAIADGTIRTACQDACPADAIIFGDLNDPKSRVSALQADDRSYQMLEELNTKARVKYLARVTNPAVPPKKSGKGGSHGPAPGHGHGGGHADGAAAHEGGAA